MCKPMLGLQQLQMLDLHCVLDAMRYGDGDGDDDGGGDDDRRDVEIDP